MPAQAGSRNSKPDIDRAYADPRRRPYRFLSFAETIARPNSVDQKPPICDYISGVGFLVIESLLLLLLDNVPRLRSGKAACAGT